MKYLEQYKVSIEWSDEVGACENTATIHLGETTLTMVRRRRQSLYKTPSGSFSLGGEVYTASGENYDSFDEAMQKGLGLFKS